MPNPPADFPAAVHTPTDISALAAQKLGQSSPKHTDVEGKQEAELAALGSKLGSGSSTPTNGKILTGGTSAGTSEWSTVANAVGKEFPEMPLGYALGKNADTGVIEPISLAAGAGETNTAANVGTAGVGPYKTKSGVQLQFKNVESSDGKITVTDNVTNDTVDLSVDQAQLALTSIGGTLSIAKGGTGQTAKTAAYDALNPNTTLGDVTYHNGTNNVRLAGNTTAGKRFLTQTGNGTNSAAPGWNAIIAADVPTLTASKISDFQTTVQSYTVDTMAPAAGNLNLNSNKVVNVADPTAAQDAATKAYVDAQSQGLDLKASVRAASTANIADLSAASTSMDGITLVQNDRVLLKDQSTASQNGIYILGAVTTGTAPLTRATDADTSAKVTSGLYTFVSEGTDNGGNGYVLTTADPITLNTTGLTFTQFSGAGQITAGAGLTKTGNTLDVGAGTGITVNANDVQISASYAGQSTITTLGTVTTGTWNATAVDGAHGGTGATTTTAGDILVGAAANTWAKLGIGGNGTVLSSDGSSVSWQTAAKNIYEAVVASSGGDYATAGAAWAANKGSVFFKRGTYAETDNKLTAASVTGKSVHWIGEDRDNTIITLWGNASGYFNITQSGAVFENITFKAPAFSRSSDTDCWIRVAADDVTFINCRFSGSNGAYTGAIVNVKSDGAKFLGCRFDNANASAFIYADGGQQMQIAGAVALINRGSFLWTYYFTATGDSYGTFISDGYFESYSTTGPIFRLGTQAGYALNELSITNCDLKMQGSQSTWAAILMTAGVRNVISGNRFQMNGYGKALDINSCDRPNIRGNTILRSATNVNETVKIQNFNYGRFDGNIIEYIGSSTANLVGVYVSGTAYSVNDNTVLGFSGTSNKGIQAASGSGIIKDNRFGSNTTNVTVASTFTGIAYDGDSRLPFALTDAATIATNADQGENFTVTLGGNRTMGNPTGTPVDGQKLTYRIRQDATGSRTLTWGTNFRFSTTFPSPTLSTTAAATDYVTFQWNSTDSKWDCVGINLGVA